MTLYYADTSAPSYHISAPPASSVISSRPNAPQRSLSLAPKSRPPVGHTPTVSTPSAAKPNLPIIAQAVSEDDAIEQILRASTNQDGPRIRIPGIGEASYERIKARTDARNERLRYFYDVQSHTIIINALPSAVHESVHDYLTDSFKYSLRRWVTKFVPTAKIIATGQVDEDLFTSECVRRGKAPDEAFRVKIPGFPLRRYPNILVEVGYSETHPDLIEDARHWLCESNGQVLCVIIFCFKKPTRESDFSDLSKWKAFVEVYERYVHLFLITLMLSYYIFGITVTLLERRPRNYLMDLYNSCPHSQHLPHFD